MSENLNPLTGKPTEPAQPVSETPEMEEAVLPAEIDSHAAVETTDDSTAEAPEEEDIDPADVRIFGLPRVGFHCTAFGVAAGYLVAGLIGLAGFNPPNATVCAIVCAAIGYFIGNRLYKKQKAARDAAEQNPKSAE